MVIEEFFNIHKYLQALYSDFIQFDMDYIKQINEEIKYFQALREKYEAVDLIKEILLQNSEKIKELKEDIKYAREQIKEFRKLQRV